MIDLPAECNVLIFYWYPNNITKVIRNTLSGSRSGLSLLLNIEQYEHMMGSQSDAGVKVSSFLLTINIKEVKINRLMLM